MGKNYTGELYPPELCHYGIKGPKWGVLRYQNRDRTWTAAGKIRYGKPGGRKRQTRGTPLRVLKNVVDKNIPGLVLDTVTLGEKIAGKIRARSEAKKQGDAPGRIDKRTGFKKKSGEMTEQEDLRKVNPDYRSFDRGAKGNCMLCTSAYELRRRGYDVQAEKSRKGCESVNVLNEWFPKAKIEQIGDAPKLKSDVAAWVGVNGKYAKSVVERMNREPEGSRGNLMLMWGFGGGHSVSYEVKDGKMRILDAQTARIYDNPEKLLMCCTSASFARLDNVAFDPEKIKECAR